MKNDYLTESYLLLPSKISTYPVEPDHINLSASIDAPNQKIYVISVGCEKKEDIIPSIKRLIALLKELNNESPKTNCKNLIEDAQRYVDMYECGFFEKDVPEEILFFFNQGNNKHISKNDVLYLIEPN